MLLAGLAVTAASTAAQAQAVAQPQPNVTVPGFWDPRRRPERPDLRA